MWTLAPIRRPRTGLSIGPTHVSLVEVARGWGRPGLVQRVQERTLPAGLLCPSATKPNIMDQAAFVKELTALVGPFRSNTVALSLPVQSAWVALLEFDSLPRGVEEQRQLILWRLRRECPDRTDELELAYRVWMQPSTEVLEGAVHRAPIRVLVAALRTATLMEYREACERAGVVPISCGLDSLQLCELYRREKGNHPERFFVHWSDQHLFFLAFRDGQPVFLRAKDRVPQTDDQFTEVLGTLQSYDDAYPHAGLASEPRPVPLDWLSDASSPVLAHVAGNGTEGRGGTMVTPTGTSGWRVEVRDRIQHPLGMEDTLNRLSLTGLSALASVVRTQR